MSADRPADSLPVDPVFSGWQYRALVLSVVLAALDYLLFALISGWREVTSAIVQVGVFGLLAALSLSLVPPVSK
jgi:hypothetical protein